MRTTAMPALLIWTVEWFVSDLLRHLAGLRSVEKKSHGVHVSTRAAFLDRPFRFRERCSIAPVRFICILGSARL